MRRLSEERCFNHAGREAAVRCPECRSFFCRECVSEHDGRFLCAACLRKETAPASASRRGFTVLRRVAALSAGIFLLWICFYACGQVLLSIPTELHEGTLWLDDGEEETE